MKFKPFIFGLVLALLTVAIGVQTPVFAAYDVIKKIKEAKMKRHSASSKALSVNSKQDDCCKMATMQFDEINPIASQTQNCACTCTFIEPSAFLDAHGVPSVTYVINTSGNYCLCGDVAFEPAGPYTPAINILANDVQLDLQGFTLSQASDNTNTDIYGVLIGQGIHTVTHPNIVYSNITVKNGSIIDFTGVGVFCYNNSFNQPSYSHRSFNNLKFLNLNILNCGLANQPNYFGSGINLDSLAGDTFPNTTGNPVAFKYVTIDSCYVNCCLGNGSVTIFTFDDLVIRNTQANDMRTNFGYTFHPNSVPGTFAYNLVGVNFQMYECQGNGATDLSPAEAYNFLGGISLQNSRNIYVKDCQFNDISGVNSIIVASDIEINENQVFENCQFNNARGGVGAFVVNGVHQSSGFAKTDEGTGVKWINCQFNGTSCDPTNATCISVAGYVSSCEKNIVFEGCQACNIHVEAPNAIVGGFVSIVDASDSPAAQFSDASNVTFRDCIATDISSGPNAAYGFLLGGDNLNAFGTQIVRMNMVVENCVAERISNANSTFDVAGIASSLVAPLGPSQEFPALFNLFIKGCRVSDVRSNSESPSPTSAGILAYAVTRPGIVENSVSDCDRGILLSGSNTLTPNTCFQLAATHSGALALPPVLIVLNPTSGSGSQTFVNETRSNSVVTSADNVQPGTSFICSATDLNTLGWQPGDTIRYNNDGSGNISPLVSGTYYYAIVYRPGFSNNGLIKENEVDNCSISGYEDDASTTTSAWINNTAFHCGIGYDITFSGVRPVDSGTLSGYPTPGNKYYNLDL